VQLTKGQVSLFARESVDRDEMHAGVSGDS
jgi:hypothetical protein